MITGAHAVQSFLRAHWFFPIAALAVAVNASAIFLDRWESPRLLEAGLLFDFAVLVPLLYMVCYRADRRRAIVRAIALACLGIWAVGHVVPEPDQVLLQELTIVRYVGLGVLAVLEVKLIVAIFRVVASSSSSAENEASKLGAETGTPPWVSKLLAWEAAIWIKVWRFIKRLGGKA
ncbi:MAG: hypothetical protein QNJ14_14170 [Woeseiaceae bacterium]|nr:hypothetical protein [Woeseiaceae bacterium]